MATPTSLPAAFVAGNVLTAAQLNDLRGGFRVLKFLAASSTTNQTTTSATYANLTGSTLTVTPQSTSNKIALLATATYNGADQATGFRLARAGTGIFEPTQQSMFTGGADGSLAIIFLDDPATTSATSYTVQLARLSGGSTVTCFNYSFMLMEISL